MPSLWLLGTNAHVTPFSCNFFAASKPLEVRGSYVGNMPLSTHSTIIIFAAISCHWKFRRTFFGTLSPRSALTTARPTYRLKRLGQVERDVRAGRSRGTLEHHESSYRTAPPRSRRFLSDPFRLPTSSGEIGTSLLRNLCASLRSPPDPLFTNHNKGVEPT